MECWFVAFRLLNFAEKYLQNVSLPTRTFIIKSSIPAPMTKNNGRNLYTPRRWLKADILVPNMSLNFYSQPSERRHVHTLCVAYLTTRNFPKPLVLWQQALNLNCKQFICIDWSGFPRKHEANSRKQCSIQSIFVSMIFFFCISDHVLFVAAHRDTQWHTNANQCQLIRWM